MLEWIATKFSDLVINCFATLDNEAWMFEDDEGGEAADDTTTH